MRGGCDSQVGRWAEIPALTKVRFGPFQCKVELLGWKETPYHLAHARYNGRLRFRLFHQKLRAEVGNDVSFLSLRMVLYYRIIHLCAKRQVRVRITTGPTIPLQK